MPTSWPASSLLIAMLWMVASCGRTPVVLGDEPPLVDPWVYALGLCALKCFRLDQCGLALHPRDACVDACIEEALDTPDDGCWSQWIEARRCRVRYAECQDIEEEVRAPDFESICAEREAAYEACGR